MSTKFSEYKQLNLTTLANTVLDFWEKDDTFKKSVSTRLGKTPFVFYDGPPSANGMPGIHHVISRTIKDIFCRYQTLKGKQVLRKAGWDTHGLPIELGVEKSLGITKEDIGKKISIIAYNEACKKSVMTYTDKWAEITKMMGYWVDLEDPYITYNAKYMESLWWLLKEIYQKGYLYKGYTIQPYSPAAGTGLSSHELNIPGTYKEVSDTTIVAQFKAISDSLPSALKKYGEIHFLAWTTTPWTLPSNTALTVGPHINYALVKTFNCYTFQPIQVILAHNLIEKQFDKKFFKTTNQEDFTLFSPENKKIPYQILTEIQGKDLVGIRYEQLLPWALPFQEAEKAFIVIDGDFVTTEDGTGIVHTAPTFGADDALVAKKHQVPALLILDNDQNPVPLVDLQGRFVENITNKDFAGKYVKNEYYKDSEAPEKSVDVEIAILLKTENKAFKVEKYLHSYPHCWRTDKPVLYYPLDSWFIKTTAVKDQMIALNKTINWKPKSTGEGRFGNWLENVNDWNLSRSRFWGVPLPIWRTEDGSESMIIGSVAELISEIEKAIQAGIMTENPFKDFIPHEMSHENYAKIDLHKHIVDTLFLVSPSGKKMKREPDLIDVWFDSGAMPYAQYHYPFENKDWIDNQVTFPADFIAEGVDQTRGWFYTLHAIATMTKGSVAYKNVISNGLVLDKNGQKMSKSKGNAIDPFETLKQYGPDATRWYMIANAQPWENLKFDVDGIEEVRRKFFGTLYNTYSFFALYANLDHFDPTINFIPIENRTTLDRWILSELNSLIQKVDTWYAAYEPTRIAREISNFVNDNLSNWYVRLNRRRFWKGTLSDDKLAAYQTLHTCLETIAILMSPIAPFYAEILYQDLQKKPNSVHLAIFPKVDDRLIDDELQEQNRLAQQITSMVFSLRKKEQIKVRQPLQKIIIPAFDETLKKRFKIIEDIIKQEVNVKELQILTQEETANILVKQIKPNFKTLGPKYGKNMKEITEKIHHFTASDIQSLEQEGEIMLETTGGNIQLLLDDVEILTKDIEGWLVATENGLTVALDIQLNDSLIQEGIAREMINRIQNLRKDSGFEVNDRIKIIVEDEKNINLAIKNFKDYICTEVLADSLEIIPKLENGIRIELDTLTTKLLIQKI